jgi:Lon protease-like protein
MPRSTIARAAQALPLFPLPRVALFPHTLLPLHVFEPRYRALLADVMAGSRLLGVPMFREGWEADYADSPDVHAVFGLGRVVKQERLEDGRSNIVIQGLGRVRMVEELDGSEPYRRARVELLGVGAGCTPLTPVLRRTLSQIHLSVRQLAEGCPDVRADVERLIAADRDAAEQCDVFAHLCLRDPAVRQQYLELDEVGERAEFVLGAVTELRFCDQLQARGTASA